MDGIVKVKVCDHCCFISICIFIMQSHYLRFMSIQIMRVVHKWLPMPVYDSPNTDYQYQLDSGSIRL